MGLRYELLITQNPKPKTQNKKKPKPQTHHPLPITPNQKTQNPKLQTQNRFTDLPIHRANVHSPLLHHQPDSLLSYYQHIHATGQVAKFDFHRIVIHNNLGLENYLARDVHHLDAFHFLVGGVVRG